MSRHATTFRKLRLDLPNDLDRWRDRRRHALVPLDHSGTVPPQLFLLLSTAPRQAVTSHNRIDTTNLVLERNVLVEQKRVAVRTHQLLDRSRRKDKVVPARLVPHALNRWNRRKAVLRRRLLLRRQKVPDLFGGFFAQQLGDIVSLSMNCLISNHLAFLFSFVDLFFKQYFFPRTAGPSV